MSNHDITILCAETRDEHRDTAIKTLRHCQRIFPCRKVILLSDKPPETTAKLDDYKGIDYHQIDPILDNSAYSHFLLDRLPHFLTTNHVLVIQTDGYILNPNGWTDNFLDYDYIGAPWKLYPFHNIPPHPQVTKDNQVGNGGFSLRSKKIVLAAQRLYREYKKLENYDQGHFLPEDCFIARSMRDNMEEQGITFAPVELARKFSTENDEYKDSFGFHGKVTMEINQIPFITR